jgi:sulfate transport system permease protein
MLQQNLIRSKPMPDATAKKTPKAVTPQGNAAITEPRWVRYLLIATTLVFLGFFLIVPLAAVFLQAFEKGIKVYFASLIESDALDSIRLTLIVAAIAVPINTLFGVAAAWAISKFEFWGKSLLITIIDLPYSVSPVISGLVFVMLFGRQGWLGPFLDRFDIQLIFSVSGVVLATLFVTFPFVARELIPLMQSQGSEEEEAARVLGASGWKIFWRVTLPNIKWGLLYGVILCNARAMGEFGAVSVVSGHLRGETLTMPLQVQIYYDEYNATAAFALASLLAGLAIVTLVLKTILEWKVADYKTVEAQAYIGD